MEEKIETYITELKENIKKRYDETCQNPGGKDNILRGNTRSLSTDIEDEITLFISKIHPDYRYFVDFSFTVNGKIYRPDLLVVDEKNNVVAMCEIKANMGYVRGNCTVVSSEITKKDAYFKGKILKNHHAGNSNECFYGDNVKLFLISCTSSNCGKQNTHETYKKACSGEGISYFCLFDGWYGQLKDREIKAFAEATEKI